MNMSTNILSRNNAIKNEFNKDYYFSNIAPSLYSNENKIKSLSEIINKIIFTRIKISNSNGEKDLEIILKRTLFEDGRNNLCSQMDAYKNLYIKYFYEYFLTEGILILNMNIINNTDEVQFLFSWNYNIEDVLTFIDKNIYVNTEEFIYFNMLIKYHNELLNSGLLNFNTNSKILFNELKYEFKTLQKKYLNEAPDYIESDILPYLKKHHNKNQNSLEFSIKQCFIKFDCSDEIIRILSEKGFKASLNKHNLLRIDIKKGVKKEKFFFKFKNKFFNYK